MSDNPETYNPLEGDLTPNPDDACPVCGKIECECLSERDEWPTTPSNCVMPDNVGPLNFNLDEYRRQKGEL